MRLFDHALKSSKSVFCVFVFDRAILNGLPSDDRRAAFIHASLAELDRELRQLGSALIVLHEDGLTAIPLLAPRRSLERYAVVQSRT